MSLLFAEGFDIGLNRLSSDPQSLGVGIFQTGTTTGRVTGTAITTPSTNRWWRYIHPDSADDHATVLAAVAFRPATATQAGPVFGIANRAGTNWLRLRYDGAGGLTLDATNNDTTPVRRITTGAVMTSGAWHHISVEVVMAAAGTIRLAVDGKVVGSFAGETRCSTGDNGPQVRFGQYWENSATSFEYDDFIFGNGAGSVNNSLFPDCAIRPQLPNGNGDASAWVGSDADSVDNYLLVDESSPSMTDYVESATVADQDLYTFQDVSNDTESILGIVLSTLALKSDAGSRQVKTIARRGTTTADVTGTNHVLSTSATVLTDITETDPTDGSALSLTNVNLMQFGVEVVS